MSKKNERGLRELPERQGLPDTMNDISDSDIVQLAKGLLDAVVRSSGIESLQQGELTPEKLREVKMVLGYLNATNSVMKTKMSFFKMVGVDEKVREIRRRGREL
jgi:hypothetical protein